jgi:hypothetical protein
LGQQFPALEPKHMAFINNQKLFFVGTAPLRADHHVNVTPKGYDVFRILSPNSVAYLDLTGSGNDTSANLMENGRITFMFCAFEGAPMVLRLFGHGRVICPGEAEWDDLAPNFTLLPGTRQIVVAEIELVQSSCGFGVPLLSYEGQRPTLLEWAETKGDDGLLAYRKLKNSQSINGLPTPLRKTFPE